MENIPQAHAEFINNYINLLAAKKRQLIIQPGAIKTCSPLDTMLMEVP